MYKYLIMLTFCVFAQRISSKSLFEYNINPEYDLIAQESTGYLNFWPSSDFLTSPQIRYKHHARGRGHGNGYGKRKHELPPHAFDLSDGYNYPDSFEEYNDNIYQSSHPHHPHGIPPGQAKKYGHRRNHPHVIPPRFPPPPVYDKNFMNPWTLAETTPKLFVQQPPLTTPRPFIGQQPPFVSATKSPTLTTSAPPSPKANDDDDELLYDIDVRFGRE